MFDPRDVSLAWDFCTVVLRGEVQKALALGVYGVLPTAPARRDDASRWLIRRWVLRANGVFRFTSAKLLSFARQRAPIAREIQGLRRARAGKRSGSFASGWLAVVHGPSSVALGG
jgi:hypothetical protein